MMQYAHIAPTQDKIVEPTCMPRTAKTQYLGEKAQKITSFLLLEMKHIFVQMASQENQPEKTASARSLMTSNTKTTDDHRSA